MPPARRCVFRTGRKLKKILQRAAKKQYGVRSLVTELVQSDLFPHQIERRNNNKMNSKPAQRELAPFVATRRPMSRRRFLGASRRAVTAVSGLDDRSLCPRGGHSSPLAPNAVPAPHVLPFANNPGCCRPVFPEGSGSDYVESPYLELLKAHRNDFTVFSGVSHPNVDGGHRRT